MIRLLRSVSVRLALGYGAIFILSSFLLVGALWWRTAAYLDREVDAVILADAQAVGDRLHDFGLIGALETVRDRVAAESDEHAIYLLADPGLHALAGNLNAWPAQIAGGPGWYEIGLARNGKLHATRMIYAALPGGYRLLVGRDVQDRVAIRGTILGGLGWAVVIAILLAIGGGLLIRRAVLRQVEAINRATAAIVRGDLARRLPTRDSTDEFDQLSQTINGMLGQIQILIEGVRNASNTVAHDLRTPLAELRNRLEELLRRRPPPEEAWTEVQDEVAELYGPVAEAKGSDLAFDPPSDAVTVQGDPDLLAQAISNLVDNAVKFTPAGGRVALAVTRDADGGANVRVTDSGPGIADSEKAEVVRRFYRGDAGKGKSGVGLGLSVVAAVAKLHGGRLEFADGNPGLVATLILPATTAPGALPGPAS